VSAFKPDAHNLFKFQQGMLVGSPDFMDTYLHGDYFNPAERTLPKMIS